MPKHQISHAEELYFGNSDYTPGISYWDRDGMQITPPMRYNWGGIRPATADVDAVSQAKSYSIGGALTFNGSWVTNGIATFDVPRNITINTTGISGGSTMTYSFLGTDLYGAYVSEWIMGPNSSLSAGIGLKAFKTVISGSVPQTMSIPVSIGFGSKLGLPFTVTDKRDVLNFIANSTVELSTATVTGADTTSPATATTGDPRGTVTPNTAANSTTTYTIWFAAINFDTKVNLYGVDQYYG